MKLAVADRSLLLRTTEPIVLFEQVRRLGLQGVEIGLTRADLADPQRLLALKAAKGDLHIPSIRLLASPKDGLETPEAATTVDTVREALTWAAELGVNTVILPLFVPGEVVTDEAFDRAVDNLFSLTSQASTQGVSLCYQGTLSAADMQRFAAQIGSPVFGTALDLANVIWRGMDTLTEILALGNLLKLVRLRDIRVNPGDCALGKGCVDFAASAAALRHVGFDGWLVLDTPPLLSEVLGREISYARRIFPEVKVDLAWPRIGAFSYVFNEQVEDPVGFLIQECQRNGLKSVQLGLKTLDIALESPESAAAVRQRLESNGITVTGIAGYRNLVSLNPEKRRNNLEFMRRCLEFAPLLGTAIVATETGTMHPTGDWSAHPDNWTDRAWAELYAVLDDLVAVAEANCTILALEGYVNNVLATQNQLIGVLDRYTTQHLQVMLDPYNYLSKGLLPAKERLSLEFLERFESRFVLAHLKDVAITGAEVDTPEFGLGVFPQKPYLDYLRTVRPDLPLVLEHLPGENVPATLERINALIQ